MMKTVPLTKTTLSTNLKGCLTAFGLALFVQFSASAAVGTHPAGGHVPLSCRGSDTIHSIQVSKAQSSKKSRSGCIPMPGSRCYSFPPMAKTERCISYSCSIWMAGW